MQTRTLLFGLTVVASALAAPVPASNDNAVATQSSGAGIWTRAEVTEAEKREEDAVMHTEGAGIWTRAETEESKEAEQTEETEEDGVMHTAGAGIWTRTEASSDNASQLSKRTGFGAGAAAVDPESGAAAAHGNGSSPVAKRPPGLTDFCFGTA
ncbi:hypothetical protein PG993_011885 [Apiospora rasikravindrae]|uniref:Uncharacterized protein n=1 Tax=Apiospora rasikravindrae TaxID=990691 RepID=A0ABR1S0W1_9PEZI